MTSPKSLLELGPRMGPGQAPLDDVTVLFDPDTTLDLPANC